MSIKTLENKPNAWSIAIKIIKRSLQRENTLMIRELGHTCEIK